MPDQARRNGAFAASSRALDTQFHCRGLLLVSLLRLFAAFAMSAAGSALAAQPLITPAELAAQLGDSRLRIVDIRERQRSRKFFVPCRAYRRCAARTIREVAWTHGQSRQTAHRRSADCADPTTRDRPDDSGGRGLRRQGFHRFRFGSPCLLDIESGWSATLSVLNGGMTAWRAAGLPGCPARLCCRTSTVEVRSAS